MLTSRFDQYMAGKMSRHTRLHLGLRLMVLTGFAVLMGYITYLIATPDPVLAQNGPPASAEVQLGVAASPNQEVPPVVVSSNASGAGVFTINAARTEIAYDFTFTGPFTSLPQQVHIHLGAIGATGPPVFFLCATDVMTPAPAPAGVQACPGMNGGTLQGTLTQADFVAQAAAGAATFEDALNLLIAGNGYLNLHTPDNPSGEVRGQLGQIGLGALLSSASEVPPVMVASDATGIATVTMPPERRAISYEVTLNGPFTGDVTAVHIHVGDEGASGPVIFNLCPGTGSCLPMEGGSLVGTLLEGDLMMQPGAGIQSLADAIDAVISGRTYINAHTAANPPGEVRGQILVALTAQLSSAAEVPPVTMPSNATGSALVVLSRDRSTVSYSLTLDGPFTSDITQAHIHVGAPDAAGPPAAFLCGQASLNPPAGTPSCPNSTGGTVMGAITADNFIANPAMGFGEFDQFVTLLLGGGTYVNVHTEFNPPGEIRGQIEPVQHVPAMDPPSMPVSFAMDIQPIFNANCGCHLTAPFPQGLDLSSNNAHSNLVDVPSQQNPNFMRVAPGDPANSYLIMKHAGDSRISGGRMPLNNETFFDQNPELLELERTWVMEGARNN